MRAPFLALLAARPSHGYELRQTLEQEFGDLLPALNAGQIYTTLARLERDGLVEGREVPGDGRGKRVYALTDAGRAVVNEWIEQPVSGTRLKDEFFMKVVIVAAAGLAPPQALIDAQRQEYLQSLRELNDLLAANGRRPGRRAPAGRSGPAPEGRSRVARADRARSGSGGGGDVSVVLEARNLAKTYDTGGSKVLALRGIDLAVRRGEFVAIRGPSGCGKSTLLNLLAGLDRPTAGRGVAGRRAHRRARRDAARPPAPPQDRLRLPVLQPDPDAVGGGERRAAAAARRPAPPGGARRGRRPAQRPRRAGQAAVAPSQLSGGQQQRVALARALAAGPDIVLADEPTGNLDSASARDVMGLLRAARDRGQTLLLVTHDASVASAADRVITLRDGLVVDESQLAPGGPHPPVLEHDVRT